MPKIKIDYGNMIFYKVCCLNPSVNKIFVGHTTNMVQRKHVLKKQSEIRYLEMFDVINNNGGWKCWRIKELEKYRLENRMSQEKLAVELDVAFCTVNRWFKNRNEPNQIQEFHIKKMLKKQEVSK